MDFILFDMAAKINDSMMNRFDAGALSILLKDTLIELPELGDFSKESDLCRLRHLLLNLLLRLADPLRLRRLVLHHLIILHHLCKLGLIHLTHCSNNLPRRLLHALKPRLHLSFESGGVVGLAAVVELGGTKQV